MKRFLLRVTLLAAIAVVLLALLLVTGQESATPTASAQDTGGERMLVWVGNGAAPGEHSASEPGQLVYMFPDGEMQPVMEIPPQTSRVVACGGGASSPDDSYFAFFVGLERGQLFLMQGADTITQLDDDYHTLGCTGKQAFQYSPDSSRFAMIDYNKLPADETFPATGRLRLGETASASITTSFENAAAFALGDDSMAYVGFFTNDEGEATEAGVFLVEDGQDREVSTLFADEDCRFTSAEVGMVSDGRLVAVMGQRCRVSGQIQTQWQFYTVDPETRSATLALSDQQPASFFWYARSNNLYTAPDGTSVLHTIPDGLTASSTSLVAVNVDDVSSTVIVPNNTVMPRFTNRPYLTQNHLPVISPDGRWLALTTNTANDEATLLLFDLNNLDLPPIEIAARDRGDTFAEVLFTPDSSRVVYVAGAPNAGDNSLFALDLETENDFRVERGHFAQGAISPDGSTVALMEWQIPEDDREPNYVNLVTVDVETGERTTLFEGAEIVDGEVTNQQFAFPLTWRSE